MMERALMDKAHCLACQDELAAKEVVDETRNDLLEKMTQDLVTRPGEPHNFKATVKMVRKIFRDESDRYYICLRLSDYFRKRGDLRPYWSEWEELLAIYEPDEELTLSSVRQDARAAGCPLKEYILIESELTLAFLDELYRWLKSCQMRLYATE